MNSLELFGPSSLLYELCVPMAQLSVDSVNQPSVDNNQQKSTLREILLLPHKSMAAVSEAVLQYLFKIYPDLHNQIQEFQREFSGHIDTIQNSEWSELKKKLGSKMQSKLNGESCSLEEFRVKSNAFIAKLTNDIGQKLGFSLVEWTTCGTTGYNSDVDTTIKLISNPPCIDEAILYKTLRDCLHTFIFGGLSGVQLDTECYPPHVAEINLSQYLYSPMSHRHFQAGEKASVYVQRYLSLHHDVACYEQSKERDLTNIKDPEEQKAMRQLCGRVESLMQILESKVQDKLLEANGICDVTSPEHKKALCREICLENRHAYKQAREVAFIPIRVRLAQDCKVLQQKIKSESQILALRTNQVPSPNTHELNSLYRSLDRHHLALQRILIVLASLQDGGTISASEGKVTLLQEGGQLHNGVLRDRKTSMSGFLEGRQEVLDKLSEDPVFRRRASLPLCLTLRSEHGISNEIAKIVLANDVAEMLKPSFQRPTGQTFLMAAYEESMQLEHMLCDHLDEVDEPGRVVIDAGKYALRVTRNLLQALKEFAKEQVVAPGIKSLIARANKLEIVSASLEKCKRGVSINTKAATKLLTKVIILRLSGRGSVDQIEVQAKVEKMFRNFDFGGVYFEKVLPKEQHLDILCTTLTRFKALYVEVENPQILEILQAHAGFDQFQEKYTHLKRVHEAAASITLKNLKLTSAEEIRGFLSEVSKLGADVRNVARDNGLFSLTTESMVQELDLAKIVQNAI